MKNCVNTKEKDITLENVQVKNAYSTYLYDTTTIQQINTAAELVGTFLNGQRMSIKSVFRIDDPSVRATN